MTFPAASPLDSEDLPARVMRVIAQTQKLPLKSVTRDKTFQDLKIDSLDGINIVFALESEFNVSIPDQGIETMQSVEDAIHGIEQLMKDKPAAAE